MKPHTKYILDFALITAVAFVAALQILGDRSFETWSNHEQILRKTEEIQILKMRIKTLEQK